MLKNVNKYDKLKLIDLKNCKTINNNGKDLGISTTTYGSKWFLLPKGKAIFKTFDDDIFPYSKNIRMINELVCYELAKMIGIPCAEYDPAFKEDNGKVNIGVVSYKVNSFGQSLNTVYDVGQYIKNNTLKDIYQEIAQDSSEKGIVLDKNFKFDLFKVMVFDTLTLQQDRHLSNIHILDYKKQNFRMLSPLIDNEMAFAAISLNYFIENDIPISVFNIMDDMNRFNSSIKFIKYREYHNFDDTIKDIINYAKTNVHRKNFLKNAIKNLDIKTAIKNVEEKGIEINQNYKKYMIACTEYVKQIYQYNFKHSKEEEELSAYL